jgi:tetratricopeptide (TPR) repeat protein
MSRCLLPLVLVVGLGVYEGAAAEPPAAPPDTTAEAYYHFLLGRHHEAEGDAEAAMAAHEEAARLDPGSAEIRAEMAGLAVRQGRAADALRLAREAVALDQDNREANRLLGQLLASAVEPESAPRAVVEEAIVYLERSRRTDGVDIDPSLEITLARFYVAAARYDEAAALLDWLIEREPMPEAYLLLAHAHATAGRVDEAGRALEAGAHLNPRLLVSLADLYERHERWAQAASTYERAAALNPHLPEVKVRWAGALLNVSGPDAATRARTVLEEVTRAQPSDARALYLLSQAQRRSGDFPAAERTARRVVALDPEGLWGPYALAQVHEDRHDYRAVVEVLRGAVETWRPSQHSPARHGLVLMTRLGLAHLQLGEHDAAIAVFDRARAVPGADTGIHLQLAQAYVAAGRHDDALRALEPVTAANPRDLRAAQIRARAVKGLGRTDEAIAVLEDATASHPGDLSGYLALATLFSDAERHADALRVLDEAEGRFPGDVSVLFQRGAAFERAQDPQRAEASFRAVLARDPAHAPALNYLGYMLADRGERLPEAVELIQRALAVDPENAAYLDSLGWAFYRMRDLDRALQYLSRAARKMPANSVVQDHYGDALVAAGRHADAIAAWERALAGDREAVDVATIEQKLRGARERVSR